MPRNGAYFTSIDTGASTPFNTYFTVPLKGKRAWATIQWILAYARSFVFERGCRPTSQSRQINKIEGNSKQKLLGDLEGKGRGQLPRILNFSSIVLDMKIPYWFSHCLKKSGHISLLKLFFLYLMKWKICFKKRLIKKRVSKIIVNFGFMKNLQCSHCNNLSYLFKYMLKKKLWHRIHCKYTAPWLAQLIDIY